MFYKTPRVTGRNIITTCEVRLLVPGNLINAASAMAIIIKMGKKIYRDARVAEPEQVKF